MRAILPILDDSRMRPYYLQLYDYIKNAILSGEITEGERLPSLRNLANATELSVTTVEQCYNQLLVEGYIYSRDRSGYYVEKVLPNHRKSVPDKHVFYTPQLSDENDGSMAGIPDLKYDPDCFDFNKWKKCMNKVLTEYSPALFFESDPQGEPALRNEISRYLYMSRGVSCSPKQIIIGAGTQQITNHLATILRKLGIEHVALESPGYMPVRNIFRDRGFAITTVDVTENGLVIEKLPANIRTAAYVSPSNHLFTGAVMPVGRRYELLDWAERNDSYIIEDDYDSELRYFGKPVPALRSLENSGNSAAHKERTIYLGSFSSTLFAAVKISYMVLPSEMAALFSSMAGDYSQTCSKLEQLTLAMFMETGRYQTHIKKLRKLYAQKLAAVTDLFQREAPDLIALRGAASGMYLTLQILPSDGTPSAAFQKNKAHPADAAKMKRDADLLGVPVTVLENDLLLFYYNHIPLHEIPQLLKKLIYAWRS